MKTINRNLITVIKDMPLTGITLDVVSVDDRQFYEYRVNFLVDQIAAYDAEIRAMRVDVAYKRVGKTFSLQNGKKISSASSVNNLIINANRIKNEFVRSRDQEQKDNTITTRSADIFSRTRKFSLFRLRSTNFIDIVKVTTEFNEIESNSNLLPNQAIRTISSDLVKTPQAIKSSMSGKSLYSSEILKGRDPANQIAGESLINDAEITRKGLGSVTAQRSSIASAFTTVQQNTSNNRLPKSLTSQKNQNITSDTLVPHTFRIPVSSSPPSGNITVICTIRKSSGELVQKIDFSINHSKQVIKYNIPKSLPHVGMQFISKTSAQINIFNKDPAVSGIRVYDRSVPSYQSITAQQPHKNSIELSADSNQRAISKKIALNSSSNRIIRTVPVLASGIVLGNFESKTKIVESYVAAGTVVATSNKGKVTVSLYNHPSNYKYIQFARRSIDRRQKSWDFIQNPVAAVKDDVEIEDLDVLSERTYEYTAFLQDTYGNTRQVRSTSIVKVADYTSGTEIKVLKRQTAINNGITTSTFDISVTLSKDSDTTAILNATKELGIDNYYEQETLKLSGDLSSITKVNVKRISIDTGEIKDLGSIAPGEFSDSTRENVIYLFEGLLRSQADLFEEIGARKTSQSIVNPRDALQRGQIVSQTLTATTQISKRNFTQKFLTKKSLLRGTLSYGDTKSTDKDSSGFLQGRLGIVEKFAVNSSNNAITISNFKLTVADESRRLLTFNTQGTSALRTIDFFIISTIKGNVRSTIGACHYVNDAVQQNFLDDKTSLRTGKISYVITPVRYDGSTLPEVTSQQFEVM